MRRTSRIFVSISAVYAIKSKIIPMTRKIVLAGPGIGYRTATPDEMAPRDPR